MKWVRIGLIVLAGILLAAALAVAWILNSTSGARWAYERARGYVPGELDVRGIDGTLAGPLHLSAIRFNAPDGALAFSGEALTVDVSLSDLLARRVRVEHFSARGIRVNLGASAREEPREEPAGTFDPPIDMILDDVSVEDAVLRRQGEDVLKINRAAVQGSWTRQGIEVRRLELYSPEGEVHLSAHVDREAEVYVGDADGRFRWRAGERTFAGSLRADSKAPDATLHLNLTEPTRVQLNATVRQVESWPWTMRLDVPAFPAQRVLTETELKQLALALTGEGDLETGHLTGHVQINDERIDVRELRFTRSAQALEIRPLAITLREGATTATLAGSYAFEEQLARIEQLLVKEAAGELDARGEVRLAPQLTWQADVQASNFNPGEFASDWPGKLNFAVQTQGTLTESGPDARLQLNDLRGQLRGRRVSGNGDVQVRPGFAVTGNLQVRSGGSRLRIQGERAEAMDVTALINIASLDDWLPQSGGRVQGRIRAQGEWPDVAITGRVSADALAYSDSRIEHAVLDLNVSNLARRTGSASLDAREISAGDGSWRRVQIRGSGDPDEHSLQVTARGRPVGGELLVRGRLEDALWTGTLEHLRLNVRRAGRFALEQPAALRFGGGEAGIATACLVGEQMRLCVAGQQNADGSMQASYEIEDLPLQLLTALAELEAPLRVAGLIDGRGQIQRAADGSLSGTASLRSESGEIAHESEEEGAKDEKALLLAYRDFAVDANLAGETGTVTVSSEFNDGGRINAQVALANLRDESPSLDGRADVSIPSLAAIELFVPQVTGVQGRLEARGSVRGTTADPQIEASARIIDFGAHFPDLGIELREGNFELVRDAGGALALDGGVTSGPGRLSVRGRQPVDGPLNATVRGENVLVANIPAAVVQISPDLQVQRIDDRVQITGKVVVPTANVNLQRMPTRQAKAAGASPDVVVIDDPPAPEAAPRTRLQARIDVLLGEDVKLQGYGLDAKVSGQLEVREDPGSETVGSGEVRVSGTYKAYGQDLTIERGSLLFAGTPLNDPRLDIRAWRQVEDIRAGLQVSGTAENPQLTVISDPALPEAEALAYLVTGRSLNQVGSGEGDMLQSAARSLGTAAGNLLARSLGKRFGVDQLGIEKSEALGGSAFTVGEYLSPRLFLSYGVGLFTPGDVVTLRYRLAEAVQIEASSAPNETRTSIHYRAER